MNQFLPSAQLQKVIYVLQHLECWAVRHLLSFIDSEMIRQKVLNEIENFRIGKLRRAIVVCHHLPRVGRRTMLPSVPV